MIGKALNQYINDINHRMNRIQKHKVEEEDIIYLLKDLTVIIDTLNKLKETLAEKLDKYITKN